MTSPSWPKHLDSLLPDDRILKGQYRLTGFVGEGGSGAVFEGVQDPLERPVAIKVMYPGHHARVRERFLREAQAVAGLRHPNVVTVYDFGLIDELRPYIVMELLHGHNLAEELHEHGPMQQARALPLFMECLEALAEAHDKNLIHRDLKPDNLFLSKPTPRRETLQILDFGIALFTHDLGGAGDAEDNTLPGSPRLTPTGQKVGTPHYLAPEYFESGTVSAAMDVYAMGLVLAEMMMGHPVVQAEHFYSCVVQHITGNLKFPEALLAGPLGPVIRKATAKSPADRYPDAHALLEGLENTVRSATNLALSHDFGMAASTSSLVIHADTELSLANAKDTVPEGYCLIMPGSFQMGSPEDEPGRGEDETLHEVVLTRPYLLQSHEVTQEEWAALMEHNPSEHQGKPNRPVEQTSWYDAIAYCNALSEKEGLKPYYQIKGQTGQPGLDLNLTNVSIPDVEGIGYRLPTEAEWEHAARAGGDSEDCRYGALAEIAWYSSNSKRKTRPVGDKAPNAWGLYDMLGNVWEWTWDRYSPHGTKRVKDPTGPSRNPFRIYRGGGYSSGASICRAANRGHTLPQRRSSNVGFRLARYFS